MFVCTALASQQLAFLKLIFVVVCVIRITYVSLYCILAHIDGNRKSPFCTLTLAHWIDTPTLYSSSLCQHLCSPRVCFQHGNKVRNSFISQRNALGIIPYMQANYLASPFTIRISTLHYIMAKMVTSRPATCEGK